MKNLVTVVGARPQFVKAAVVSKALHEIGINEIIVHTGQHYDHNMSAVFWEELNLNPPGVNLETGSGTQGRQTAECLQKLEKFLLKTHDTAAVMLYGDTNSTLAGALASSKLQIPVIHVEAGLRSFNRAMPEEINRVLTDHASDILFCSSAKGVSQLKREGIDSGVYNTGDVMQDAVQTFSEVAAAQYAPEDIIPFKAGRYNLATIHRPANTEAPSRFKSIIEALEKLDKPVVWPVHPRNNEKLKQITLPGNIHTMPPASYFEMLVLIRNCHKVLTDSGGLQKEAYWMKKPCITLREETEWTETLEGGWNILTGADTHEIVTAYQNKPDKPWVCLYGDGHASEKIAAIVKKCCF